MRRFGLIGKSLSHSFSASYFSSKFKREKITETTYRLYEMDDVSLIRQLAKKESLDGFNVTIPFKESIIPYLDYTDPIAKAIKAVNTVKVNGDQLLGFNTDYIGFQKSIRPFLAKEHRKALILGTGGASKAIEFVLQQFDIQYFFVSRTPQANQIAYSELDDIIIKQFQIVINCTPLGTSPNINDHPPIPIHAIDKQHFIYDLIYNPEESYLLSEAKKQGALVSNGLNMLKIQAEESWKIWNS